MQRTARFSPPRLSRAKAHFRLRLAHSTQTPGVTEITASGVFLRQQSPFMLIGIKLLHTVIWAFLAGCILALPVLAVFQRFRWAAIITVVVLLECGVLAVNGGRCPLTDMAARYTLDRGSNFDIYLPNWLA